MESLIKTCSLKGKGADKIRQVV